MDFETWLRELTQIQRNHANQMGQPECADQQNIESMICNCLNPEIFWRRFQRLPSTRPKQNNGDDKPDGRQRERTSKTGCTKVKIRPCTCLPAEAKDDFQTFVDGGLQSLSSRDPMAQYSLVWPYRPYRSLSGCLRLGSHITRSSRYHILGTGGASS
jgi:hypothetical protein